MNGDGEQREPIEHFGSGLNSIAAVFGARLCIGQALCVVVVVVVFVFREPRQQLSRSDAQKDGQDVRPSRQHPASNTKLIRVTPVVIVRDS